MSLRTLVPLMLLIAPSAGLAGQWARTIGMPGPVGARSLVADITLTLCRSRLYLCTDIATQNRVYLLIEQPRTLLMQQPNRFPYLPSCHVR